MSGFVLHPDALTDLNEIWEYIAADNLDAADRVLEEIHEAIRALVPYPQTGHRRSDLTSRPLRFHPLRDFLIVYAPDEKTTPCPGHTPRPPQSSRHRSPSARERMSRIPRAMQHHSPGAAGTALLPLPGGEAVIGWRGP